MSKPDFIAKVAIEKKDAKPDDKPFWHVVGAAWKTKDGKGIQVRLNSLPLDGTLLLYPPKDGEGDAA